jgi:hypothetical protein
VRAGVCPCSFTGGAPEVSCLRHVWVACASGSAWAVCVARVAAQVEQKTSPVDGAGITDPGWYFTAASADEAVVWSGPHPTAEAAQEKGPSFKRLLLNKCQEHFNMAARLELAAGAEFDKAEEDDVKAVAAGTMTPEKLAEKRRGWPPPCRALVPLPCPPPSPTYPPTRTCSLFHSHPRTLTLSLSLSSTRSLTGSHTLPRVLPSGWVFLPYRPHTYQSIYLMCAYPCMPSVFIRVLVLGCVQWSGRITEPR